MLFNFNYAIIDYAQSIQNHNFINKIAVEPNLSTRFKCRSLLVHENIFDKFLKILEKFNLLELSEGYWNFTLCIRKKTFAMKLIWFPNITDDQCKILSEFVKQAQFSFVWEKNAVLYRPLDVFHNDLESFVNGKKMSKLIKQIDLIPSISYTEKSITVIEFIENIPKTIIDDYKNYINEIQMNSCIINDHASTTFYYIVYPFGYLVPDYLKYLAKPFYNPDAINQVNLLLEYGREMAKRNYEVFNIIDLCHMKLAIDDSRWEYENCEFLKLINKLLYKMANERFYLIDRVFNLSLYCIDKGIIDVADETLQYFVHNFQNHFDCVNKEFQQIKSVHLSTISSIPKLLTFLQKNEQFPVSINGTNYDGMSPELFLKLIKYGGTFLQRIILDTNFGWPLADNYCAERNGGFDTTRKLTIQFVGRNETYFIENFFNWLKSTFGVRYENIELCFWKSSIKFPFIMSSLHFNAITLHHVVLNTKLLGILKTCTFQTFNTFECVLDNDHIAIQLLEDINQIEKVHVLEEEHTCETLFTHISYALTGENCTNEYRFKQNIVIYPKRIELNDFMFRISPDRSKVEICEAKSKDVIDIFEFLKFMFFKSNRDEFEFYD